MTVFLTAALYKFVELSDFEALQAPLLACCQENNVKGTILLAAEGINGTIAGLPENVYRVLAFLRQDPRLADLTHKESSTNKLPFYRIKVRLKREIVTMGVPGIDPAKMAGQYVKPEDWNALLTDPDVVVVDARNDYEVSVGTFRGAINPQTKSFSELPDWLRQAAALRQKPKVAMFCTGGIRCEKSTAFLRSEGFEEVYHLEGGILKYLETVPETESLWEGECFVFDERVTVVHGLQPGNYELCRACRNPISAADKASELFVEGVSCPTCYGQKTEAQQKAFAERQRQVELARRRNQVHIGQVHIGSEDVVQTPEKIHGENLAEYPILYSFRRCPYAMRSRLALAASGQICELREVILRDKPQELLAVSPKGTVPVLVKPNGSVLEESLDIMQWALERHDPEGWLTPEVSTQAEMLALIAQCDSVFKHHLDRYKYAARYPGADAQMHRAEGAKYLAQLDEQLSSTPYLFGSRRALADMAIAPFVRQFMLADADWFGIQSWPHLQAWLKTWLNSDILACAMQKYEQWVPDSPRNLFPTLL
ncbi:MAG: rhodanese-related sulfurtransferase [Thermosynechococcaceae cyanobacterium MS004]|nr:rhodanese-related sulfurtransferase [Thermosynechococcaceae cyanobacterium MS004]